MRGLRLPPPTDTTATSPPRPLQWLTGAAPVRKRSRDMGAQSSTDRHHRRLSHVPPLGSFVAARAALTPPPARFDRSECGGGCRASDRWRAVFCSVSVGLSVPPATSSPRARSNGSQESRPSGSGLATWAINHPSNLAPATSPGRFDRERVGRGLLHRFLDYNASQSIHLRIASDLIRSAFRFAHDSPDAPFPPRPLLSSFGTARASVRPTPTAHRLRPATLTDRYPCPLSHVPLLNSFRAASGSSQRTINEQHPLCHLSHPRPRRWESAGRGQHPGAASLRFYSAS